MKFRIKRWYFKEEFLIAIIGLLSFINFVMFTGNFKLVVAFQMLLFLILAFLTRKILLSLLSFLLFSAPFIETGKYYSFQLATPESYHFEPLPFGVFEHFGLVTSDIFAFLLLLFLIRELVTGNLNKLRIFLNQHLVLTVMVCAWTLFFLSAMMTSYAVSFYPEFSLVVLLQYSKLLITFIGVVYLKIIHPTHWKTFLKAIGVVIGTQVILGLWQFVIQLLIKSTASVNPYSYVIPEENFFFPRIRGSFNHANDFAFTLYKLTFISLSTVMNKKKTMSLITILLAILGILLSQSRTVWLSLGVSSFCLLLIYRVQLKKHVQLLTKGFKLRYLYLWVGVLFLIASIVVPRLYLSLFFFSETGGGSLRSQMVKEGLMVAQEKMWFGYGVGTQVKVFLNKLPNGYTYSFPYPIHNFYVWLLVETGVVGVLLFFAPFYLLVRKLFSRVSTDPTVVIHLFLIVGILLYYIFQPSNGRVDFVFLGLALGSAYNSILGKTNRYEKKE